MTSLEFLCRELMGPPTHTEGGCPCWPCPACGHRSWHVRPHRPEHKDRFACWSCGGFGDEHDLLRLLCPELTHPARVARLDQLRAEHERRGRRPAAAAGRGHEPARCIPPGTGSPSATPAAVRAAVDRAWDNISPEEMRVLALAFAVARREGVELTALARLCAVVARNIEDATDAHVVSCTDPGCDFGPCRAARTSGDERRARLRAAARRGVRPGRIVPESN